MASFTKNAATYLRVFALLLTIGSLVWVFFGGCSQQTSNTPVRKVSNNRAKPLNGPSNRAIGFKADARFVITEVTSETGLNWTYHNDNESELFAILESLGGGIGVFDFDRDGVLDIACAGGGRYTPDKKGITSLGVELFRGEAPWRFSPVGRQAGFNETRYYNHGISVNDFDADGFPDVLVTGYGGLQLFHNMGDGSFQEICDAAGLKENSWSTSVGWGDFNNDGHIDLYVAHYVNWSLDNNPFCPAANDQSKHEYCSPRKFLGLPDAIYLSNGDGTFRDASQEVGLRAVKNKKAVEIEGKPPEIALGKGLGVVTGDVDNDGDIDIYVGNDTVDNFLWVNDGTGHFVEKAIVAGVAVDDQGTPNGSMGVDMCDYDRDGLTDIFAANFEQESFAMYRNDGNSVAGDASFSFVSHLTGITSVGDLFVGFGAAIADYDQDGDEDIYVANGHVSLHPRVAPIRQQPLILENVQKGDAYRFLRMNFPSGSYCGEGHAARGMATTDMDGDGDLDIVVCHTNEPVALLQNDTKDAGDFLKVTLAGRTSNRNAIGAKLTLKTDKHVLVRHCKGGYSYLSSSEPLLHWGIPKNEQIESLEIQWPSGKKQTVTPERNQALHIVEPL
jgi:hypothetical protein